MNKEKQILIVSCVYPPEPYVSAQMSEAIALELSKKYNVTVLCPPVSRPLGNPQYRKFNSTKNYNVISLPSFTCPESKIIGRLRESYSFGKYAAEFIGTHHDSIKVIYANTHPTFGQYLLIKKAQQYNIPIIIHVQDIYPESITKKIGKLGAVIEPLLVWFDKKKMVKSTKIITISPNMRHALIRSRHFKADFVDLVYNWQDESKFNFVKSNNNIKFTFMFAGSLNPTASVETIIEAFGISGLKDARLVLAGEGNDKQHCIDVANRYANADIVFETISPKTVPYVQANAAILLLPLKKGISSTALPSKLPAYMFSAKPIIACVETNSDISTIIHKAKCGWIIEPENPKALSMQMIDCFNTSKDYLDKMGESGKQFALSELSMKENLAKICNIITSI